MTKRKQFKFALAKEKQDISAKLATLIESIEFNSEVASSYLNLKTGEIVLITEEVLSIIEDDVQDYPTWLQSEINHAKNYLENPDDYLILPSQEEVNEYQMMEDFTENLQDINTSNLLLISLRGNGAFRRFKYSVVSLGLEKEWYQFRDQKYREFTIAWCEENKIAWEE